MRRIIVTFSFALSMMSNAYSLEQIAKEEFMDYAYSDEYLFSNPLEMCRKYTWDVSVVSGLAKDIFNEYYGMYQDSNSNSCSVLRVTAFSLDFYGWCSNEHEITNVLLSIIDNQLMNYLHPYAIQSLLHHITINELPNMINKILENDNDSFKKTREVIMDDIMINSLYFPERKEIMFNTVLAYLKEKGTIKDLVLFDDCAKYYLPDYINSPLEREILLIAKKILSANSEQNKGSQELMKRLEVMQQKEQDDFNRNTERNISNNPESTSGKVILRERLLEIKRHEKGEWLRRNAWWMICGVCALLAIVFCIVAGRRRGK